MGGKLLTTLNQFASVQEPPQAASGSKDVTPPDSALCRASDRLLGQPRDPTPVSHTTGFVILQNPC